jgi:hypothetical protein
MRSPARHSTTITPRSRQSWPITGRARDRDDLLDRRRAGRTAVSLVTWRATSVEAGQGRRRPTTTGGVEQQLGHAPSSGSQEPASFSEGSPREHRAQRRTRVLRSPTATAPDSDSGRPSRMECSTNELTVALCGCRNERAGSPRCTTRHRPERARRGGDRRKAPHPRGSASLSATLGSCNRRAFPPAVAANGIPYRSAVPCYPRHAGLP